MFGPSTKKGALEAKLPQNRAKTKKNRRTAVKNTIL
jgi:hypothetical protein